MSLCFECTALRFPIRDVSPCRVSWRILARTLFIDSLVKSVLLSTRSFCNRTNSLLATYIFCCRVRIRFNPARTGHWRTVLKTLMSKGYFNMEQNIHNTREDTASVQKMIAALRGKPTFEHIEGFFFFYKQPIDRQKYTSHVANVMSISHDDMTLATNWILKNEVTNSVADSTIFVSLLAVSRTMKTQLPEPSLCFKTPEIQGPEYICEEMHKPNDCISRYAAHNTKRYD